MVKISATKQKLKQKAKRANPNSQFNKNKLNNRKGNKPAVSVLKRQNQKSTKSKISESREKRERKQDRKQSFKPKENNHFEKPKEKQKDLEIVELENENGAEDYEKTPRKSSDKQKKVFNRMPVKDDKGKVVFPKENLEPVRADENEDDSIENDETVDQDVDSEMADEAKNPETVEERDLRRQNARIQIAQFASKILSGPEEHVLKFDPLINLCKENDELIQRLAVASVTELFKETIPGYKIREPTERELQQKLSKEVKALWTFEKNYLQRYKSFISLLVSRTKALTRQLGQMKKLKSAEGELDLTSNMEKNIIALKCACQLLLHAPHFNFTKDIVHAVTGFLSVDQKEISSIVYDCISSLFKKDKLNDVSIEIVQKLVEVIKNDPYIENELVLKVLLSLPFHDSLVDADVGRENESDVSL
jgi:nucleolar complex protein 3